MFVYKLIAQGTLEERMLALQERKAALADSILAGGASLAALREDEVLELFAPLDTDG